mmetsp:Transcript_16829/g.42989  ORF Transcript_16829/g.42989 Transcript_16829/m.42989 type:complete len:205 (-) Transcript_16829:1154-1768(-)
MRSASSRPSHCPETACCTSRTETGAYPEKMCATSVGFASSDPSTISRSAERREGQLERASLLRSSPADSKRSRVKPSSYPYVCSSSVLKKSSCLCFNPFPTSDMRQSRRSTRGSGSAFPIISSTKSAHASIAPPEPRSAVSPPLANKLCSCSSCLRKVAEEVRCVRACAMLMCVARLLCCCCMLPSFFMKPRICETVCAACRCS